MLPHFSNGIMKRSQFRNRVRLYELFYFLPFMLAITIIQFAIFGIFQNSMGFYIFYPFVYIALEINIDTKFINYIWFLNALLFFPLGYVLLKKYNYLREKKFLPCPNCSEMVLIFYHWGCGKCRSYQETEKYVTSKCGNCGSRLDTFVCENCEEEFRL